MLNFIFITSYILSHKIITFFYVWLVLLYCLSRFTCSLNYHRTEKIFFLNVFFRDFSLFLLIITSTIFFSDFIVYFLELYSEYILNVRMEFLQNQLNLIDDKSQPLISKTIKQIAELKMEQKNLHF